MSYIFDIQDGSCHQKGRVYRVVDRKTNQFLWWEIVQKTFHNRKETAHLVFSVFDPSDHWGNILVFEHGENG